MDWEELRENVTEIVRKARIQGWQAGSNSWDYADEILTLFQDWLKQQIEKLEPLKLDWHENPQALTINDYLKIDEEDGLMGVIEKASEQAVEAQLQADKDKLLRMME